MSASKDLNPACWPDQLLEGEIVPIVWRVPVGGEA